MTARKNRIRLVGALLALVLSLSLGGCAVREGSADDGRLRVVTTLFPYYDFARAVAGDRADVTLLLSPGREAHSFEPTPLDAVTISHFSLSGPAMLTSFWNFHSHPLSSQADQVQ